jgi:hypothetical protein
LEPLALLSGDAQAFLDKVWASRVHLHHTEPEALVALLSLDDVDRLLTGSGLRTPAVRVVRDGDLQAPARFTRSATIAGMPLSGLVDARKALDLYDDGATIVLQGLQRFHPPLTRLVRELELVLGHPCQANAYLTPPGSQGFARHRDTHDVFVFQTHGHKQWEIVDGQQERDILLEPGLCLYLPTGTPHSARSQEVASLHVTIGINRLVWRDVLRERVQALLADPRYDRPLPAGYLAEPDRLAGPMAEKLRALADHVSGVDPVAAVTAVGDRFLTGRPPVLAGGLRDRELLGALTDDTVLVRRPTAACELRPDDDLLRVLLGDRELRMPARLRAPMSWLREQDRFSPADLGPWLDPTSRLVLCRRLVREGLLQVRDR